ncbi:MAG: flagellar hook-associated protein FlgK [Lentisphaeria bacterium]|jgi:flagellar hook-associated protein FlgK
MLGSVINEGVRGIAHAQREIQKASHEIANASVRERPQEQINGVKEPTSIEPVNEARASSQRGIEEPLIELRRQEQLFTANAAVVKVGNDVLGSIINVRS